MLLISSSTKVPDTVLLSVLDASPFYFTVKKGNTALLDELNHGMQQLITTDPELVLVLSIVFISILAIVIILVVIWIMWIWIRIKAR